MAKFRVVCTKQVPSGRARKYAIIVGVGTGKKPRKPDTFWTVDEVLMAMDHGHKFYTKGEKTKKVTTVVPYRCGVKKCKRWHLTTKGDLADDNDLNSLRRYPTQ